MSVSRSSSSSSLRLPDTGEWSGQDEPSEEKEKKDSTKDVNVEHSRTSNTVDKTEKKKAIEKKLVLPVVRTPVRMKLNQRERSVSSPVLLRPLPSSITKESQTPDAKANATSRQSKEVDTGRPPKQPKQDEDRLPSSPPKLRSKPLQPLLKPLTTEQQLANDLADLMGKIFLRKKEKVDDEIPVSQMTASLQRFAGKPADAKIRITDLMLKMFSDVMKKSKAWDIASRIMATIRREYFQGRDAKSVLNPRLEKEATDTLTLLASSFAGAFFNISGNDEKNRLPEPIRLFLHAADHQQIRVLLSTPAGIAMSKEEFLRGRRDWLAKVLVQTFLKPLVLKEFSLESGTVESNNTADHIVQALHIAFKTSAQSILFDSLRSPPDDIAELMFQRRANQFKPRADGQEPDAQSDGKKIKLSPGRSSLMKTTSPNHQRRVELKRLLTKTIKALNPATPSGDMLRKLKEFNNEFATSSDAIDHEKLLKSWMKIATAFDDKSPIVAGFQQYINDLRTFKNAHLSIEKELLNLELSTKLAQLESSGQALPIERARRLSSDLPLVSPPDSTASLLPPVSSLPTPSSSTPIRVNQPRATRSPASPKRHTQHKRSKTADVILPAERALASGLTNREREMLIKAFPDLLLEGVKRAAMVKTAQGLKINTNPVKAISEAGRNAFDLPLEKIPQFLREKILALRGKEKMLSTISHSELWGLLMTDAFVSSRAGRVLLAGRFKALNAVGTTLSVTQLVSHPDKEGQEKRLNEKLQPHANSVLTEIFGKGLAQAGLPDELLAAWQDFDRKLQAWAAEEPEIQLKLQEWAAENSTATQSGIDVIRSRLGFDLVVTRLIYKLALGKKSSAASAASNRFGTMVQRSIKVLWDTKLFDEFNAMPVADAMRLGVAHSSSTSQTPSVRQ